MAVDYTTGDTWKAWNGPEVYHAFPKGSVANGAEILRLCKESLKLVREKKLFLPYAPGYRSMFCKDYGDHYITLSCDSEIWFDIYSYRALIGIPNTPDNPHDNFRVEIGQFNMLYHTDQFGEEEVNPPTNEELEKMLEMLYNSLKDIYEELSNN